MQITLEIDDVVCSTAKAAATRLGITLSRYIEDALRERIARHGVVDAARQVEIEERARLMESLLQATSHFRIGVAPTREEMAIGPGSNTDLA
jgi:hypothetical protein